MVNGECRNVASGEGESIDGSEELLCDGEW